MKKKEFDKFMDKCLNFAYEYYIELLEKENEKKDKIINYLLKSLNTFGYKVDINDSDNILTVDVRQDEVYKSLYDMIQNSARV